MFQRDFDLTFEFRRNRFEPAQVLPEPFQHSFAKGDELGELRFQRTLKDGHAFGQFLPHIDKERRPFLLRVRRQRVQHPAFDARSAGIASGGRVGRLHEDRSGFDHAAAQGLPGALNLGREFCDYLARLNLKTFGGGVKAGGHAFADAGWLVLNHVHRAFDVLGSFVQLSLDAAADVGNQGRQVGAEELLPNEREEVELGVCDISI